MLATIQVDTARRAVTEIIPNRTRLLQPFITISLGLRTHTSPVGGLSSHRQPIPSRAPRSPRLARATISLALPRPRALYTIPVWST